MITLRAVTTEKGWRIASLLLLIANVGLNTPVTQGQGLGKEKLRLPSSDFFSFGVFSDSALQARDTFAFCGWFA